MHTNPHPTRIAPRFLASNALSLAGMAAGVAVLGTLPVFLSLIHI